MTTVASTQRKTDNGVPLTEGVSVVAYWDTVLTDSGRTGNFAGWFDVRHDDGTRNLFNGTRMTTQALTPDLADPRG